MIRKKKAKNFKRREPLIRRVKKVLSSQRVRGVLKTGLGTISVIVIFAAGRFFYNELLNAPFLQIKEVNINGVMRVSKGEVLELMGITPGDNIIAVDADEIRERVERHPWIKTVKVGRRMPDKILVEIKERVPFAIINLDALYLIDDGGSVFKRVSIEDDVDLPVISAGISKDELEGDEEVSKLVIGAIDLISLISGKIYFSIDRLSEIKIDPVYGLTLYIMDSGTRIEIGHNNFEEKLNRLDRVINELGNNTQAVETIDLNYGERVVVRLHQVKNGIKLAPAEPAQAVVSRGIKQGKKGGDERWVRGTI
ncbi:MAG: hypothetical protein A2073_02160 [Deltaproteobacteria bacterium GWC2_42_11]|nr:MAG: hypothetical protein A2073_02160 [Deltaproteobacteria bacterium GWC2_42_11]